MRYRVHFAATKKLRICPDSEIVRGMQEYQYYGWVDRSDPDAVIAAIQECYERANVVKCHPDAQ